MILAIAAPSERRSIVKYCAETGEVIYFELDGFVLLDSELGFVEPGWSLKLSEFVATKQLHVGRLRAGVPAFVCKMIDEGRLCLT